jgi:hypothetical protein
VSWPISVALIWLSCLLVSAAMLVAEIDATCRVSSVELRRREVQDLTHRHRRDLR